MINSVKTGQRLKVTSNGAGHGFEIGSYVISQQTMPELVAGSSAFRAKSASGSGAMWTVYPEDVEATAYTLANLLEEKAKSDRDSAEYAAKIQYLTAANKEAFDEIEYRAYMLLKVLSSSSSSEQDKLGQIASILKSGS